MNHETALSKATEIAGSVLAPAARQNDKDGQFSAEAVDALGRAGLLGLTCRSSSGGRVSDYAPSRPSPRRSPKQTRRSRWSI